MLQKMRDQTQSFTFKVLVGLIVFVLAVFGFGAFNLFVTGDPGIASVNGKDITQSELAVATQREQRRLAARMGGEFDPSLIDPVQLQGRVLEQMIARRLLEHAADELGVAVSGKQVDQVLVENPAFQVGGRFQADVYRQAVQSLGFTPQGFMDDAAQIMALEQLQTGITDSAFLTRRELNVHASLLAQKRDVAYLPFDVDRFRSQVTVTEDEVQLRYEENQRDYMTQESVDVAYVSLSSDKVADDPSIEVSEEAVRNAYEAERAMAPPEEERRSRHILLETGDARTAEEAVARLEELRARIEAGEAFADIARETSDDAGSAVQGGDLGFAGRGVFDPAFEDALFALEQPGAVSTPVESEFGYHLIKLEEIRTTTYPDFEQMRAEIEQQLRQEQALALYEERLRSMDNLAFEHPNDLQAITDELGLDVQTVEGVTRQQGPAPFDDPALRAVLFSQEVLE
jgi:peptidyl-prolyl cis-trans isomerase D